MSQTRRRHSRSLKASLLLGGALLGIASAGPALAQSATPAPPAGNEDDGLGVEGFYLESDLLIQDDANKRVTARGDVEMRYRGRTLRAGEIVYDVANGVVTARDKVTVVDTTGAVTYADSMVLDEQMRAGIIQGFSARLQGDARITAATAMRRSDAVNELNRAAYTPCPACAEDPGKPPSWSIRADKVVQDRDKQIIYYRNAVIEMFGVPVFYAPVFWHADPTAGRKSGLLQPKIVLSERRGLSYEQPYAWIISPSQDLVISPQVNSKVNPLVNFQWRKRFWSGQITARFGYTYERDISSDGDRLGDATSRSYLLADGAFDLSDHWRWGFAAERASDDLIFDKYDIGDVHAQRGLVSSGDRRLTSQLYAVRQDAQSYVSIAAVSIQGLRPIDVDRTFPTIAPLVEARWEPERPVLGGRLRLLGSAVALSREQSQFVASDPGVDSRRASAGLDWRRETTFSGGVRLSPFVQARADAYSLSDLTTAKGGDASVTRALGVAGVDVAYPLWRRDGDRTIVLEPLLQVALSPDSDPDPRIPNEDSQIYEFDETTLLRADKFPGFDLYEGGQRINVGGRATVMYEDGRSASLLVGRSFRREADPQFTAGSGLRDKASDWVVAAQANSGEGLSFFGRARFDADDGTLRRMELGANAQTARASGFVRYLRDNSDVTGVQREDVDFAGDALLFGNWGVTVAGVRDVENDVWRRQEVGALYRDDCLDMAVVWVHEETYNRQLGPSDSVILRLTLATLGDKGYRQ